jgi:hypothetical protein
LRRACSLASSASSSRSCIAARPDQYAYDWTDRRHVRANEGSQYQKGAACSRSVVQRRAQRPIHLAQERALLPPFGCAPSVSPPSPPRARLRTRPAPRTQSRRRLRETCSQAGRRCAASRSRRRRGTYSPCCTSCISFFAFPQLLRKGRAPTAHKKNIPAGDRPSASEGEVLLRYTLTGVAIHWCGTLLRRASAPPLTLDHR